MSIGPASQPPYRPVMDRRHFLMTSLAGSLGAPLAVQAQQVGKVYRIGVLSPNVGRSHIDEALETRMNSLGWISGQNIEFIYRYSRVNDALPALATELVQERVDVILTAGTPASLAAKHATTSIPVVFFTVGDPVWRGTRLESGPAGG